MDRDKIGHFQKDEIRSLVTKYRSVIEEFLAITAILPQPDSLTDLQFCYLGLPRSVSFLDADYVPTAIRRMCMQTVIDRARYLIDMRPLSKKYIRVAAEINLPRLSGSGIIVFYNNECFRDFFEKGLDNKAIEPLGEHRSIEKEWVVCIPDGFTVVGMQEEIQDAMNVYKRELWYVYEQY